MAIKRIVFEDDPVIKINDGVGVLRAVKRLFDESKSSASRLRAGEEIDITIDDVTLAPGESTGYRSVLRVSDDGERAQIRRFPLAEGANLSQWHEARKSFNSLTGVITDNIPGDKRVYAEAFRLNKTELVLKQIIFWEPD